jgi:hypothetical protein
MPEIYIKVKGIDKLIAGLDKFPRHIGIYIGKAGGEAANHVILNTEGLKKYPPATAANAPPTPYYIRGRGTQTAHGNRGNSERLGTQWHVKRELSEYTTEIGNRASYAKWVHGEEQAHFMKPKGWRKLTEVATEKLGKITKVYQAWIDKCIEDLGL